MIWMDSRLTDNEKEKGIAYFINRNRITDVALKRRAGRRQQFATKMMEGWLSFSVHVHHLIVAPNKSNEQRVRGVARAFRTREEISILNINSRVWFTYSYIEDAPASIEKIHSLSHKTFIC